MFTFNNHKKIFGYFTLLTAIVSCSGESGNIGGSSGDANSTEPLPVKMNIGNYSTSLSGTDAVTVVYGSYSNCISTGSWAFSTSSITYPTTFNSTGSYNQLNLTPKDNPSTSSCQINITGIKTQGDAYFSYAGSLNLNRTTYSTTPANFTLSAGTVTGGATNLYINGDVTWGNTATFTLSYSDNPNSLPAANSSAMGSISISTPNISQEASPSFSGITFVASNSPNIASAFQQSGQFITASPSGFYVDSNGYVVQNSPTSPNPSYITGYYSVNYTSFSSNASADTIFIFPYDPNADTSGTGTITLSGLTISGGLTVGEVQTALISPSSNYTTLLSFYNSNRNFFVPVQSIPSASDLSDANFNGSIKLYNASTVNIPLSALITPNTGGYNNYHANCTGSLTTSLCYFPTKGSSTLVNTGSTAFSTSYSSSWPGVAHGTFNLPTNIPFSNTATYFPAPNNTISKNNAVNYFVILAREDNVGFPTFAVTLLSIAP